MKDGANVTKDVVETACSTDSDSNNRTNLYSKLPYQVYEHQL